MAPLHINLCSNHTAAAASSAAPLLCSAEAALSSPVPHLQNTAAFSLIPSEPSCRVWDSCLLPSPSCETRPTGELLLRNAGNPGKKWPMAEGQSEHESWPEGSRLGGLVEASVPNPVQGKKGKRKRKKRKRKAGTWSFREEMGDKREENGRIRTWGAP